MSCKDCSCNCAVNAETRLTEVEAERDKLKIIDLPRKVDQKIQEEFDRRGAELEKAKAKIAYWEKWYQEYGKDLASSTERVRFLEYSISQWKLEEDMWIEREKVYRKALEYIAGYDLYKHGIEDGKLATEHHVNAIAKDALNPQSTNPSGEEDR